MNFPSILEIATTDVKTISKSAKLSEAISLMLKGNHRHIVIREDTDYFTLNVYDVLRINRENIDLDSSLNQFKLIPLPTINKSTNILETLDHLHGDYEHIAAVNQDGSLYGLVAQSDILSSIDPDVLMNSYRLSDMMRNKKRDRWVDEDANTLDVLNAMEKHNLDATIIMRQKKPIGIVTSKDVLGLLKNHSDLFKPISVYMSHPVVTIHQNSTINEALQFMQDKHFKRIVTVNDSGHLVGTITQKELISITYTRWIKTMKKYQEELNLINKNLEIKSEKYEKIAATDSLTGLYNRIKFMELFISEYTVMVQRHNALSLLLIDLDYFKKINDNYGHNTGDDVLKEVSNILLHTLRSVDIACRWGGEEFVALLPAANLEQATRVAEEIRNAIESHHYEGIPKITASIGVTLVIAGDNISQTISRADTALYEAKEAGRNCVRTA